MVTPTIPIWAKPTAAKPPTFPVWGKPSVPDTIQVAQQAAQRVEEVGIPLEGIEIEEGIRVMSDYSVVSNNQIIGSIDPATGSFIEREPTWWEKIGNIVKWLPPNISTTLMKDYGFAAIEKVDLPFMIQEQAKTVLNKEQAGRDLSKTEQVFLNLYEKEVGDPPDFSEQLARLHPAAPFALTWAGAKLDPSEELKKTYYESVGIGTTLLQGLTAPLSIALFTAGGLGGATAMESRLAQIAARGGRAGRLAQVGRIAAAPIAGYEWAAGKLISTTVGGAYRVVMRSVLKRQLHSWASTSGVEIPKATEDAFIKTALANLKPSFMTKEAIRTLFNPVKGGYTVTQAGTKAAEQAAANAVRTSPLLLGRAGLPAVKPPVTGVVPSVTGVAPTVTGVVPAGIEFRPITTPVGKGYEIIQNGGLVGEISYTTEFPGIDGIVIDRIDIVETAQRQGLATQAIQRVLGEAEASGVPLYTGMLEPDGVKLFNALEKRGLIKLTRAKQTMLGSVVTRGEAAAPTVTGAGTATSRITYPQGRRTTFVTVSDKGKVTASIEYYDVPDIKGIAIDMIHTEPGALRKGYATRALNEVLADTESRGLTLYSGAVTADGMKFFKGLERKGLITLESAIEEGQTFVVRRAVKPTAAAVEITASEKQLRQSIMATVKTKGLSESKYRALFKKVGKTRNLTEMGVDKLQAVLDAVREARPIKIKGKNVITAKTENAIQALKDILIAEKKLTPEMYENLKKYSDLPTDKYESRELFITERQARNLIRQMNVEAEVGITEWDVRVAEGLANKPELKTSIDNLTSRIVRENKPKPKKGIAIPFKKTAAEISEFPNDVGLSGTMSILRALRRFQEQLGGREVTRIYENAEMMVEQRRLNEIILANTVNAMKMQAPQLATMIRDKEAMARIQQWLDADLKITDIAKPDLAPAELEVAQLFRARYDQWKNAVRLERFKDAYYHYGGRAKEVVADLIKHGTEGTSDVAIPDAPLKDIKEAIGIYETQGEAALKTYLDAKDWGVLKSGYSFSQILHPKLRMYRGVSVKATTTSLHQRKGLDFLRDERTAWERLIAYERQMIGLNLQPYYRKMDTEFRKAMESGRLSPEGGRDAANKISLFMREVKGYPIESPVVALLLRIGGWSFGTLSKVPWMSLRNIHQNAAFGVDKSEIVKAIITKGFFRNPLTKRGRLDYTDALVHQYKGVTQEQMLMGYMGRTPLENLIRKSDYYHLSDKLNRYLCMAGQGEKAEVALRQYLKDRNAEKFLENSSANELSATEQIRILEYLALETYDYGGVLESVSGGEAAIRDIASKITTLIHFNYVRYLRSAMEMGETGRIIGSLVAFPRSVVERYVDIFSRTKRLGGADRKRAIHSLIAMVVGSAIASAMLSQITGKERDAYNPLLVFQWQVGGLAIGATQELMELYRLISNLTFAEEEGQKKFYMDELVTLIPRLGDMFIPFYAPTMNLLESLTESRYLDRKQLRQIREVFDENYELNEEYYKIERDWLERVQHGLFGTRTPDPSDLESALKDLEGLEDNLGGANQDGDIYTTSQLGSDVDSAIYGLDPSEIITENGFSDLVLQRLEYQAMREIYFDVNADKRYDYREANPEVDANLFFWSYVTTLQSDTAKQLVQQMIRQFGIPASSIRGYENVFGTEGGIPVWGGETQEPTIPTETPDGTPTIPVWGK